MPPPTTVAPPSDPGVVDRLAHFPVSFFASVMGMTGLTIATRKVETALGASHVVSPWLFALSAGVFALIAIIYLIKLAIRPRAVVEEWSHPVRISFFPAMSIGLILLSIAALPMNDTLSRVLWTVGSVAHLALTVAVLTTWINHSRYEVVHLNPAWFIPVVGNILVPIAGVHHAGAEVSWFFMSVGLVFWPVLLTVVVNRLIFRNPLSARMVPTMFILIAPPAVGFLSWTTLTGDVDAFARILLNSAAFFMLLMLPRLGAFARLPFTLSWWAYSFPLAALTIAFFAMSEKTGSSFHRWSGFGLYVGLAVLIAVLLLRTLTAMRRGEICAPEH